MAGNDPTPTGMTVKARPPRLQLISYWCKDCGAFLFTAPNSWRKIGKNHVLHRENKYRYGDIEANLDRETSPVLLGAKTLKGIDLQMLYCKGRDHSGSPCRAEIALYCHKDPDKKRDGQVYVSIKHVVIRRGKSYDPQEFWIEGDSEGIPPKQSPPRRSEALHSSPQRSLRAGQTQSPTPVVRAASLDQGFPDLPPDSPLPRSSPGLEASMTEQGSAQPRSVLPYVESRPGSRSGGGATVKTSATTQPSAKSAKSANASLVALKALPSFKKRPQLSFPRDFDLEESDDDIDMIAIRSQNEAPEDHLSTKVENQAVQLQQQGRILSEQELTIKEQDRTVKKLLLRVDSLEKELQAKNEAFGHQLAKLTRQFQQNIAAAGIAANSLESISQPVPKRRAQSSQRQADEAGEGRFQYRYDIGTAPQVLEPDDSGDAFAGEETQATREYLAMTVREDDSDDEDFEPSQDRRVSQAAVSSDPARIFRSIPANPLLTQARPLERSPNSKNSAYPRIATFDSRTDPVGWAKDLLSGQPSSPPKPSHTANMKKSSSTSSALPADSTPGNGTASAANDDPMTPLESPEPLPSGHTGRLIHRGVSGGRRNVSSAALTHHAFAANGNKSASTATSTPASFDIEPEPKRPYVDLGSGSFINTNGKRPSSSSGAEPKRDSEGYLLKSNGQRDLRSVRGRTLGNAAFKPSNGHRVTVDSLVASGIDVGSAATSAAATPTTHKRIGRPPGSKNRGASASRPLASSPHGHVTTISAATAAAREKPQPKVTVGEEAERVREEKIRKAYEVRPEHVGTYSKRHAEFMKGLGLYDDT